MRQLIFLTIALILALFAQNLISGADALAPHILRDSLIVSAIAAALFAIYSSPWQSSFRRHGTAVWSILQIIFVVTGAVCAVVGGGLFALGEQETTLSMLRLALWLLGIVLFGAGMTLKDRADAKDSPLYRWQKDEEGQLERVLLEETADGDSQSNAKLALAPEPVEAFDRTQAFTLVNALIALATLLRMWALRNLPSDCLAEECATILRITNITRFEALLGIDASLFDRIAWLLMQMVPADQSPLRLASALISIIAIPIFYLFVRQVGSRVGSLLATMLLVVSPWFLWVSSSGNSFITIPLWLSLCGWLLLRAYGTSGVQAWALAGLACGAALSDASLADTNGAGINILWWLPLIAWVTTACVVALLLHPLAFAARARRVGWLLLGFALTAAPMVVRSLRLQPDETNMAMQFEPSLIGPNARLLLEQLWWRGDFGFAGSLDGRSLLGWFGVTLVILGFGVLLRFWRLPSSLLLLGGLALFGATAAGVNGEEVGWSTLLLPLLPFLFVLSALALDQLANGLLRTWQVLIPSYRLAFVSLVALLAITVPTATRALDAFGAIRIGTENAADTAIGRYLLAELQADGTTERTYFVPPSTLISPSVRAMAGDLLGDAVAQERVRPFDLASDLLFTDATMGDLIYLTPLQNRPVLDLLTQIYPNGEATPQFDESENAVIFVALNVSAESLRENLGLRTYFFPGGTLGDPETAVEVEQSRTLLFNWSSQSPVPAPFSALWQGTLLVPEAGDYRLTVESGEGAAISLLLDQAVVLDTAFGQKETEQILAKGAYAIEARYQSNSATDFSINWQPPGESNQPIPQSALRSIVAPNTGLLGVYYSGPNQQGAELLRQKDLVVGLGAPLPAPYSVRWQGRVAAARTGEYMFGALGEGDLVMRVDGHTLIDSAIVPTDSAAASDVTLDATLQEYIEGLIFLNAGWHSIEIDYTPDLNSDMPGREPGLRLFWQPAGGTPDALPMRYLLPIPAALLTEDLALPSAPTLAAAWLGDEQFALSQVPAFRKPQMTVSPGLSMPNLPRFTPDLLWQIDNGCGPADQQLTQPRGVAVDTGTGQLYVADTGNQRVVEYDVAGLLGRVFRSDLFQEPFDVDILQSAGSGGTPLVLDALSQQIMRIDLNASTEVDAIQPLPQETGFYRPRGFAVDLAGNLLVADTGGARMVMMNPEGQVLAEFGGNESSFGKGQPVDLMSASGRIWAVTAEDGRLWRLEGDATHSGSVVAVQPYNTFDAPHLADLPDGSFFLTDPAQHTIRYYAATGEPISQFAFPDMFEVPVGIDAVLIDGQVHLVVTDSAACTLSMWRLP